MIQLDLDAIEARANAATPGPWDGDTCDGISQHWTREKPWLDVLVMEGSDSWGGCNHRISVSEADAEFIAQAREDVPALVKRVRELDKEVEGKDRLIDKLIDERDALVAELEGQQ